MKNVIIGMMFLFAAIFANAQEVTDTMYVGDFVEPSPYNMPKSNGTDCKEIRIVIHVVYDGQGNQGWNGNISENQVLSQIRFTNMVLRNDSLGYNEGNTPLGYTLKLAETDPNGNPTTGITYTDGTALFGQNWHTYGIKNTHPNAISEGTVANALAWGTDVNGQKYMNHYVVPKIDGNSGSGVQAYAYFPTTSVVYGSYNLYNTFGCYQLRGNEIFNLKAYTNRGYTFTHEFGHNLGLFHTFQGNTCATETNCAWQGDRVCDTPPQTKGVGNTGSCGFNSHNVMDYLNQTSKNRFTAGQIERANLVINQNLIDYLVCRECNVSADFNGDGYVNILDVSWFVNSYLSKVGDPKYHERFDLNCDGVINMLDFGILSSQFGNIIGGSSSHSMDVPEKLIYYDITGKNLGTEKPTTSGLYIFIRPDMTTGKIVISDPR